MCGTICSVTIEPSHAAIVGNCNLRFQNNSRSKFTLTSILVNPGPRDLTRRRINDPGSQEFCVVVCAKLADKPRHGGHQCRTLPRGNSTFHTADDCQRRLPVATGYDVPYSYNHAATGIVKWYLMSQPCTCVHHRTTISSRHHTRRTQLSASATLAFGLGRTARRRSAKIAKAEAHREDWSSFQLAIIRHRMDLMCTDIAPSAKISREVQKVPGGWEERPPCCPAIVGGSAWYNDSVQPIKYRCKWLEVPLEQVVVAGGGAGERAL